MDLHMHGPIGFSSYWLRKQGYSGKNLLKRISDVCFEREIAVCAITSESDYTDEGGVILRNTPHDRLGFLVNQFLGRMPAEYDVGKLGDNSVCVMKNGKSVFLVNAQTVIIDDDGRRVHTVAGSNSVPNGMNYADTVSYCNDSGLLHGMQKVALGKHGTSDAVEAKIAERSDFVEGHDAQMRFDKDANRLAKDFALEHDKPWIAVSNAHRIEDAGIAYILFDAKLFDASSEEKLFDSLKGAVRGRKFYNFKAYESMRGLLDWSLKFKWGVMTGGYKEADKERL